MISIIMPAFNAEKYIGQSIESVLNQTDENWELIIIDDCSSDNTYEIINDFSKRDPRIKILRNKHNSGPSKSRNKGIEASQGEYLAFLDCDDTIAPEFVQLLLFTLSKFEVDIVYFQFNDINIETQESRSIRNTIPKNILLNSQQALELFLSQEPDVNSMCNKIFKKSLISKQKIRINEARFHGEDMEFVMKVFENLNSLVCIDKFLYNYIHQNPKSITSTFRPNDFPYKFETINLYRQIEKKYDLKAPNGFYTQHVKSILEQIFIASKLSLVRGYQMIKTTNSSNDYKYALEDAIYGMLPITYRILSKLMKISPILATLFCRLK